MFPPDTKMRLSLGSSKCGSNENENALAIHAYGAAAWRSTSYMQLPFTAFRYDMELFLILRLNK